MTRCLKSGLISRRGLLLNCVYLKPGDSMSSLYNYYWRDSRPPELTDAYMKRLDPRNPLRHIGAPRKACPATEPPPPHPADVLAKLVVGRRAAS